MCDCLEGVRVVPGSQTGDRMLSESVCRVKPVACRVNNGVEVLEVVGSPAGRLHFQVGNPKALHDHVSAYATHSRLGRTSWASPADFALSSLIVQEL